MKISLLIWNRAARPSRKNGKRLLLTVARMERLKSELKNQQEKLDTQRDRIIREANARATDIVQEAKDFADETMKNFRKFGKASISASEMEKKENGSASSFPKLKIKTVWKRKSLPKLTRQAISIWAIL